MDGGPLAAPQELTHCITHLACVQPPLIQTAAECLRVTWWGSRTPPQWRGGPRARKLVSPQAWTMNAEGGLCLPSQTRIRFRLRGVRRATAGS